MVQSDLLKMVKSTSLSEIKAMIVAKEKLVKLYETKSAIEKNLSYLEQQITSIEESLGKPPSKTSVVKTGARKKSATKRGKRAKSRKRISQPTMQSLIVEILLERDRPLSVNEIADSLLNEKRYRTTSGNFEHQLRVMLSVNKKGAFKKLGSGMYGLAQEKAPAPEKVPLKTKKKVVEKKASTKKVGMVKAVPAKPTPVKKAAERKSAPAAIQVKGAQPTIESLIVESLKEKKRPMTVYEIAGALLNEKKYQTSSKKFDVQIRIILSKNRKGLFRKLGAGKYELA